MEDFPVEEETFFKNKTPIKANLLSFGFRQEDNDFVLRGPVADGDLQLEIRITQQGDVRTRVTDSETGEEYVLHLVNEADGDFVGRVREDVAHALRDVAEHCFERAFPLCGGDAAAALEYIRKQYGDLPEFLWERTPDNFIVRRKDNGKWYAVFLRIPKSKLGRFDNQTIDVLNVKAPMQEVNSLCDGERFFPAWHMNKLHWLSIPLDGTVPCGEIFKRLDVSFREAGKK